jgi:hypothetical protein
LCRSRADAKTAVEVINLAPADLDNLSKTKLTQEQWSALFAVRVGSVAAAANRPPILGAYRVEKRVILFEPRFPLQPGLCYRASFEPSRIPGHVAGAKPVVAEFSLPEKRRDTHAVVTNVYPSSSRLPENQLKFYLHFSEPMARGEAYQHVHLLDASGREVEMPFLELGEELWDPAGKRFTLYFDPGRVKRGLKPREEAGPILEERKSYTFVIDRGWPDAAGGSLKEAYRKKFQVGPPDDQPPNPQSWRVEPPMAGTKAGLKVSFPKPMDHALLQRLIWVTDPAAKRITGAISVTDEERTWRLTPDRPWSGGKHHLVVDTDLEDLAGNSVGRPFEVDVLRPLQGHIKKETVKIAFTVQPHR